jgi:hypothetical protein
VLEGERDVIDDCASARWWCEKFSALQSILGLAYVVWQFVAAAAASLAIHFGPFAMQVCLAHLRRRASNGFHPAFFHRSAV